MKKILMAWLRADHGAACAGARRRVAWRRRVMFVVAMIGASWGIDTVVHVELLHEGFRMGCDGLIAMLIERACSVE